MQLASAELHTELSADPAAAQHRNILEYNEKRAIIEGNLGQLTVIVFVALSIITLVHIVINAVWRYFSKHPVPGILTIPCIEVMVSGFAFTALSFYASIPIIQVVSSEFSSLAVHGTVCLPYFMFLCWLALRYASKQPTIYNANQAPSSDISSSRHSSSNSFDWAKGPHWSQFTGPVAKESEAQAHPMSDASVELPQGVRPRHINSDPGGLASTRVSVTSSIFIQLPGQVATIQ